MFVRPKRQASKDLKSGKGEQGNALPDHGRAASVPNLPVRQTRGSHSASSQTPPVLSLPRAHQPRTAWGPPKPSIPVRIRGMAPHQRANDREWSLKSDQPDCTSGVSPEDCVQGWSRTSKLPDLICSKLDSILSSIDGESFGGDEKELGGSENFFVSLKGHLHRLQGPHEIIHNVLVMSILDVDFSTYPRKKTYMNLLSYVEDGAPLQPVRSQKEQIAPLRELLSAQMSSQRRTCTQTPSFPSIFQNSNCKSCEGWKPHETAYPEYLFLTQLLKILALIPPDLPCCTILSACLH